MRRVSAVVLLVSLIVAAFYLRVGVAQTAPPAWQANKAYAVGAKVTHDSLVYEALQAHTSQVGWEPPNVPALWQRTAPPSGTVTEWAPATPYALGSRVWFNDVIYEVLQAHTSQVGWEPPNATSLWQRPLDTSALVPQWVHQQAYAVGSLVTFTGSPFRALTAHTSTRGVTPIDAPGVWDPILVNDGCANQPDGAFCSKDWVLPGFEGRPAAQCRAQRCVRSNVPEAVYLYPWIPQVKHRAANEAQLRAALAAADAEPGKLHTVYLRAGDYDVSSPLTLERGNILIYGYPSSPGSVQIKNADLSKKTRIFHVGGTNTGLPLLALAGVSVIGGRTDRFISDSGAGIRVDRGGLIVEDSRIVGNQTVAGGIGVKVFNGYLYMSGTSVEGNVNPFLGNCGGGRFTAGGGVTVENIEEGYIRGSTIIGNKHCRHAGVLAIGSSRLRLSHNTVSDNTAMTFGAGVVAKGFVNVPNSGVLQLEFNTITGNRAHNKVSTEPQNGTGLSLFTYSGKVSMVGNIISGNARGETHPQGDDFGPAGDMGSDPYTFTVARSRLDNVGVHQLPVFPVGSSARTPGSLGFDTTLWGVSPGLGPLDRNGAMFGTQDLLTHLPSVAGLIHRRYTRNAGDPLTNIPPSDQRRFDRPSTEVTTPGSIDPDAVKPAANVLTFQAEGALLSAPLQVKNDAAASGGQFVEVAPGNNSTAAPPGTGHMTFFFTVPQSGEWKPWGRVIAPDSGSDSFWFKIDDEPWVRWDLDAGGAWHWDDVNDGTAGQNNAPVFLNLDRGATHVIKIAYREDGARLDRLLLTTDPRNTSVPTGTGP